MCGKIASKFQFRWRVQYCSTVVLTVLTESWLEKDYSAKFAHAQQCRLRPCLVACSSSSLIFISHLRPFSYIISRKLDEICDGSTASRLCTVRIISYKMLQDEPAPGRLSWKLHSWRMILVTPTSRLSLLKLLNYPIIMVLRNTEFISFKANICLMFLALICYLQLHTATIHLLCSMCYITFKEWKNFWEL